MAVHVLNVLIRYIGISSVVQQEAVHNYPVRLGPMFLALKSLWGLFIMCKTGDYCDQIVRKHRLIHVIPAREFSAALYTTNCDQVASNYIIILV